MRKKESKSKVAGIRRRRKDVKGENTILRWKC